MLCVVESHSCCFKVRVLFVFDSYGESRSVLFCFVFLITLTFFLFVQELKFSCCCSLAKIIEPISSYLIEYIFIWSFFARFILKDVPARFCRWLEEQTRTIIYLLSWLFWLLDFISYEIIFGYDLWLQCFAVWFLSSRHNMRDICFSRFGFFLGGIYYEKEMLNC